MHKIALQRAKQLEEGLNALAMEEDSVIGVLSYKARELVMALEQESKALEFVASEMAVVSASHIEAAKRLPALKQNTKEALQKRLEIAQALGIEETYKAKLNIMTGG